VCIQLVSFERSQQKDIKIRTLFGKGGQIKVVNAYGIKIEGSRRVLANNFDTVHKLVRTENGTYLLENNSISFVVCKSLNCSIGKTRGQEKFSIIVRYFANSSSYGNIF